ncbi:hypothetical protein Bca101_056690 [Brassica carinata]
MSGEMLRSSPVVKASYYYLNSGKKIENTTMDSTVFTHLFWAFAQIDPSSHKIDLSTMNLPQFYKFTEIAQVTNKPLQFLLSIGGKYAEKTVFDSMTSKPENRKAFIDSSISVAREYGFQGLDLAWEYPSNIVEMANFKKLIEEWRVAVQDDSDTTGLLPLLLTAAVHYSPDYNSVQYPVQAIADNLDFVNIMSYDFYGPGWSEVTGPPAALYDPSNPAGVSGDSGLRKWLDANLPAKKAVLGFSYCGWAWKLEDPKADGYDAATDGAAITPDGSVTYDEIKDYIVSSGAATYHDPAVVGFYCHAGTTWIGYDDNQSIVTKVKYAKLNGLYGYFSWHLAADSDGGLSRAASLAWDTTDITTGK